jgi:hypothetical protein
VAWGLDDELVVGTGLRRWKRSFRLACGSEWGNEDVSRNLSVYMSVYITRLATQAGEKLPARTSRLIWRRISGVKEGGIDFPCARREVRASWISGGGWD